MKHTKKEKQSALLTVLISLAIMAAMFAGCSGSHSCPKMNWADARAKYLR